VLKGMRGAAADYPSGRHAELIRRAVGFRYESDVSYRSERRNHISSHAKYLGVRAGLGCGHRPYPRHCDATEPAMEISACDC
jgi:hypothetical protein